ncbi:MAG: glycoside hydrolase family 19 protein [Cellulosilyticaceae bacterium]
MNRKWSRTKKKVLSLATCGLLVFSSVPQTLLATSVPVQFAAQATSWQASEIYTGGDQVIYNGILYEAKWWTTNEKPDPSQKDVTFAITSDWGSGFNYSVVITNSKSTRLTDWTLSFDYSGEITSAWDTKMTRNGNHYTFTPMSWNNSIPANGVITFGGGGTKTGTISNITLNNTPIVDPNPDPDPNPNPDPEPPIDSNVPLTPEQLDTLWDGINPAFSPSNAVSKVESLLSKSDFEALFPMRHGSAGWNEYNNKNIPEYYTYEGLKDAVYQVANVKYKIETRGGAAWNTRVWRLDKTTKKQLLISECPDFNAEWNLNKPIDVQIVDFGSFLSEGNDKDRKRELAAFLANLAHETGGGWATAPGGELAWGLYWNEEVSYIGSSAIGYVDGTNKDFPPVAGKSYHGRGPIQLSWNYTYGLMSAIVYGDKDILLQNPEKVVQDPTLGFMTAISFWMTPQGRKPSCHDVMANKWVPTPEQIKLGCTEPCFGVTINIINGGYEAGKGMDDYRVRRRAGHYKDITSKMNVDITGEKLDTLGMSPL